MDSDFAVLDPPALSAIENDGYALFEGVFNPTEVHDLVEALGHGFERGGESVRSRSGMPYAARNALEFCPELARLWRHPMLVQLLREVLGESAGLVRALYLDKPPENSWAVPWHKDVVIPVRPGEQASELFSKPTDRAGIPHAEAPLNVLRQMLTLRIHLDDNDDNNGPLQVLPNSHRTGKTLVVDGNRAMPVYAHAGDVLVLRPLLAHKSGHVREGVTTHRRVLQLQFAATSELPDGFEWVNFESV